MKFIYNGEYREFRGYVFKWGKATEVTDKATQEACLKDPSFWRCDEEEAKTTTEEKPISDACPKCGRIVKRGKFLHAKHCKGLK